MRPFLLSALLLATALAGCTSEPANSDGTTDPDGDMAGDEAQINAPEWQVGDWWEYDTSFPIGPFSLIVSEDSGNTWTMDTDHQELAFFHASFGEISYLGDIRKTDLAGSQEAGPVTWLDFPITHNKQWTAKWDGFEYDMVAHVSDDGQRAHIVASLDGTAINNAVYDASVGWFTAMSWGDPETGEENGRMELTDSGNGFSGEVVRVDPEVVLEDSGNGPSGGLQTITIPSHDDADLYLGFTVDCASVASTVGSAYFFALGPVENVPGIAGDAGAQNDDGFNHQGQCPDAFAFAGTVGEFPDQGTWGYTMDAPDPDLTYSVQLWLRHFERITL